jgi:hypothetical protein
MDWDRYSNPATCTTGMEVQTLLFPKSEFSALRAKGWAEKHGFKYGKVHTTGEFHRLRQRSPEEFVKGSFRTIAFGRKGIKAVVGCPR